MKLVLLICFALFALSSADRVRVRVYMEAKCPFCIQYLTSSMVDVFNCKGISDIADVGIVPFGNAEVRSDGFHCQHGSGECASNMLMTCAIKLHNNDFETYFPFIHCMETNNGHPSAGRRCAQEAKLDWDRIRSCSQSTQGQRWQMGFAKQTQDANNDYTPWVVVNGQAVTSDSSNLLGLICSSYNGDNKPACCSSDSDEMMTSSVSTKVGTIGHVCWKSHSRMEYFLRDHKALQGQLEHEPVDVDEDDSDDDNEVTASNDLEDLLLNDESASEQDQSFDDEDDEEDNQ